MAKKFIHVAVSEELSKEIEDMIKRIKDVFGIELTKISASKVIAWKSKRYNVPLSKTKLLDILGGKL